MNIELDQAAPALPDVSGGRTRPTRPGAARLSAWLPAAAVGALWLPALNHLQHEWRFNEQYHFGLAVPLLAFYLFGRRWESRPGSGLPASSWLAGVPAVLLAAAILPLVVVGAVNPDWRLLGFAFSGSSILITLLALSWSGGWSWVRHFAFPICFIAVAVPWPMQLENHLMRGLMEGNATACVEMLNLAGFPAARLGSIIEVAGSRLGVEEACSGIRSLQTMLMMGVLLGEIFGLGTLCRVLLVIGGVAVAVLWNLVRTMSLVAVTVNQGAAAAGQWHDQIGLIVLACCFGSVLGLGKLLAPRNVRAGEAGAGEPRNGTSHEERRGRLIPAVWCWGVIAWVIVVFGATELWYRPARPESANRFTWSVSLPPDPGLKEVPIPGRTQEALRYDAGKHLEWRDAAGRSWTAFVLEWGPGSNAKLMARSHNPEACLGGIGKTLVAKHGRRVVGVNGRELGFRHYQFDDAGVPLHVFFGLYSANGGTRDLGADSDNEQLTVAARMAAVMERARDRAQRQLELGVWGVADPGEAVEALRGELERMVKPE